MDTETKKTNTATVAPATTARPFTPRTGGFNNSKPGFGDRAKNPRRGGHGRPERVKPEFDQKILNIRRVTRVTAGGKRLNFSVHVVAGDKKGSVGVGTGKANDLSLIHI